MSLGLSAEEIKSRHISEGNSTVTPLTANGNFPGHYDLSPDSDITVSFIASHDVQLYISFSNNQTRELALPPIKVLAGTHYIDTFVVDNRYFKVKPVDISGENHTYTELFVYHGKSRQLNSPAHFSIGQYAGASLVKPIDYNLLTASGKFLGHNVTIKTGMTGTISSGTGKTEDLSSIGGAYTGFPADPQSAEIVVNGADTGTVWYSYMASSADTDYTFASKAITGAGTYSLGHNIWRCNFAYIDKGAGTSFNVGNILIQSVGASYKFVQIDSGLSESECAAYTVPANSAIYLDMERAAMRGAASGSLDGYWWYRENGKSPRLRWAFETQAGSLYFDEVDYNQKVPALTDIIPRITYSSANNQVVRFKYRMVKVKE